MTDIRRIIVTAPGALELRTEAPAEVGAGQVRARSVTIGVCGSDTHALHGRHPLIPMPYFPGHEVTGVVTRTSATNGSASGSGACVMKRVRLANIVDQASRLPRK